MVNAIIILDEVQPSLGIGSCANAVLCFANPFNTRFFFMTATQPLFFQGAKSLILFLPRPKRPVFDALERITFINRSRETLRLDEFKAILRKDIAAFHRVVSSLY